MNEIVSHEPTKRSRWWPVIAGIGALVLVALVMGVSKNIGRTLGRWVMNEPAPVVVPLENSSEQSPRGGGKVSTLKRAIVVTERAIDANLIESEVTSSELSDADIARIVANFEGKPFLFDAGQKFDSTACAAHLRAGDATITRKGDGGFVVPLDFFGRYCIVWPEQQAQ